MPKFLWLFPYELPQPTPELSETAKTVPSATTSTSKVVSDNQQTDTGKERLELVQKKTKRKNGHKVRQREEDRRRRDEDSNPLNPLNFSSSNNPSSPYNPYNNGLF